MNVRLSKNSYFMGLLCCILHFWLIPSDRFLDTTKKFLCLCIGWGQRYNRMDHVNRWLRIVMVLLFGAFWGCTIWNSQNNPDYSSTRAERICHPYGNCSQGTWVAKNETPESWQEMKRYCTDAVDKRYESEWWNASVTRGMEINRCMEQHGFTLEQ